MVNKENIILVGMPAAGKSTVGAILAKKWAILFSIRMAISRPGKKLLPEIIESKGVSEFCKIEEKHVLSIIEKQHVIVTGGSVVYGKKAMAHLKKKRNCGLP